MAEKLINTGIRIITHTNKILRHKKINEGLNPIIYLTVNKLYNNKKK